MTEKNVSRRQLVRLERLMDVVFALVIWRIFMLLPRPNYDDPEWDTVAEMLTKEWHGFAVPILSVAIVIVFWLQNNRLLGLLKTTDAIHTGISIVQLFCVLLFLYALRIGVSVETAADTRLLESSAAVLVGATAYAAWIYAWKRGALLADDVDEEKAKRVASTNLAEPLTALLTIPAAFAGLWAWEISWLLYPFLRWLLKRRG